MRPDFWLDRWHDNRYSLTPCSPLGKREYPDIQIGTDLGNFLILTSDESEFLLDVWGDHYLVQSNDRRQHGPARSFEPVQVKDTRPKRDPNAEPVKPSQMFDKPSDKSKAVIRSLCNVKRKRRTYEALSHLLQPL